jgi:hypothetical protein
VSRRIDVGEINFQQYFVVIGGGTARDYPNFHEFLSKAFEHSCYVLENTWAIRTDYHHSDVFGRIQSYVGRDGAFILVPTNSPWEGQNATTSVSCWG